MSSVFLLLALILPGMHCTVFHLRSAVPLQSEYDLFFSSLFFLLLLLQRAFLPVKQNPWTLRIKMGRMKRRHAADLCGEDVHYFTQPHTNAAFTLNCGTAAFCPSSLRQLCHGVDTHVHSHFSFRLKNVDRWLYNQLTFYGLGSEWIHVRRGIHKCI